MYQALTIRTKLKGRGCVQLWENTPGLCEEIPQIRYYQPQKAVTDAAVVVFPGGGYGMRAPHEGQAYAEFLEAAGIHTFVVDYRVAPHRFPLPLLDARRAVRWVRAYAAEYGIDKNKIAVMGSSAGGHLAAMLSTYMNPIDHEGADDIDFESFLPNAQILCYPVICAPSSGVAHVGSYDKLLGGSDEVMENALDPSQNVQVNTPPAFIWHTADDNVVSVVNSYRYATFLREAGVPVEMHVFPNGYHGLGLAPNQPHVAQWSHLLINWLRYNEWLSC